MLGLRSPPGLNARQKEIVVRCRCGFLQAKGPDALGNERVICAECKAKLCCWHYVLRMYADHATGSVLLLPHCHPSCADSLRAPLIIPKVAR